MELHDHGRIVVFGGSFDPPHVAHVALPLLAMHALNADAVAFVPAGQAPHKRHQTPAHHRLAMLRLALEGVPRAFVLTDEIDRTTGPDAEPSYTVDTLTRLRERLGAAVELRLLIGTDMMRTFHTWRSPARITALAEPVVMIRPPETRDALMAWALERSSVAAWQGRLLDLPQFDVNSSAIRARVTEGAPISGMVAPAVEDYIRRHGLYRE